MDMPVNTGEARSGSRLAMRMDNDFAHVGCRRIEHFERQVLLYRPPGAAAVSRNNRAPDPPPAFDQLSECALERIQPKIRNIRLRLFTKPGRFRPVHIVFIKIEATVGITAADDLRISHSERAADAQMPSPAQEPIANRASPHKHRIVQADGSFEQPSIRSQRAEPNHERIDLSSILYPLNQSPQNLPRRLPAPH